MIHLCQQIVTGTHHHGSGSVAETRLLSGLGITIAGICSSHQDILAGIGNDAVHGGLQSIGTGSGGGHHISSKDILVLQVASHRNQRRMRLFSVGAGGGCKIQCIHILAVHKAEAAHSGLDCHRHAIFVDIGNALLTFAALAAPSLTQSGSSQVVVREIRSQRHNTFLHTFYLCFRFISESYP